MNQGNFLTESFPDPFNKIWVSLLKLASEDSIAMQDFLLVSLRPNIRIAPLPIDETHTSLIFILLGVKSTS